MVTNYWKIGNKDSSLATNNLEMLLVPAELVPSAKCIKYEILKSNIFLMKLRNPDIFILIELETNLEETLFLPPRIF